MDPVRKPPPRAWLVTFAGTAVNLCLGILYAWSVWRVELTGGGDQPPAGTAMTGLNAGWVYLSNSESTWAYSICGFVFALCMIPGGRLQDRFGPKLGVILGGLCLAGGCILAGLMRSYEGLLLGFGLLGGIGMGLGYAAATPAAVRWFGPHQRGLVVGLVVAGYGGAAIYIAPLAKSLIAAYGISGSFLGLGSLFAAVVVVAGLLLASPPAGYQPPAPPEGFQRKQGGAGTDWNTADALKTWQFYTLVFLFFCSSQSGLLVIANAARLLRNTTGGTGFFAEHAWLLPAYGGLVNALGRVGTGLYSDRLGRANAYAINGALATLCLLALPFLQGQVVLLFLAVGVAYWQYGGGLALLPAFTADYFGAKNLGFNYGLVFLGWGIAFFVPLLAGFLADATGSLDLAFAISAGLLACAVLVSRFLRRPVPVPPTATSP